MGGGRGRWRLRSILRVLQIGAARGVAGGAHIGSEGKMKSRYRMIAGPSGKDANVGRIKETMCAERRVGDRLNVMSELCEGIWAMRGMAQWEL